MRVRAHTPNTQKNCSETFHPLVQMQLTKRRKNSIFTFVIRLGGVAQLVERLNGIQEVRGSTPLISTIKTHTKGALKRLPCVSFSLSFIRFKGFSYPFFFLVQYGCRFLPTCYLTQELSNPRTISNFYNLCTKSSLHACRHKKIIAPLHP